MKKKIKLTLLILLIITIITTITIIIINVLNDKTKLTVEEKKWINSNLSTVQNINVLNDVDVFGNNGYGVFFDFLNDLSKEHSLKINPITYNLNEDTPENGFILTHNIDDNSVIFYTDYYVLLGKEYKTIKNNNELQGLKIGILKHDSTYLSNYLKDIELTSFENEEDLKNSLTSEENKMDYILVPRTLYTGFTIKNDYVIVYHLSDIKIHYIYQMTPDDYFSSIIKKYFIKWQEDKLSSSINSNLLSTYTTNLNLTEKDITNLRSKVYNYGFVNNSPYEVLLSGKYGGIVSMYLNQFKELTGIEFKFTKYKNYNNFANAVEKGAVDIYFNYYKNKNDYKEIPTGMFINYDVIAKTSNNLVVNSINSLKNKEVYVLEDSLLYDYLLSIGDIDIKTYKNIKELSKISKKDSIIIIDNETYNYLSNKELKDYNIRYNDTINSTYNFKVKTDDTFTKLFTKYIMTKDPKTIVYEGLYNHNQTVQTGSLLGTIAKYIIYIIIAVILLFFIIYRSTKKIKISKKIKKEDKIKFIDQLTSLKNRNYLNENIDNWNKNRIYPQATIIIDLNKVQEINDKEGYDEGDKQIKAASNILIRTQLDNTDIMRTDGNEFLIYSIGYDKKSIESYIRKLIREFKKLPYKYSATISYSMITDDLKTIEDAINEAVDDMKEKKKEV